MKSSTINRRAIISCNNATTTLATAVAAIDTTISVADASAFPDVSGVSDYAYITLAAGVTIEIIKVTDITGNVLTCDRGQDDTTASDFSLGDRCGLRITAGLLDDTLSLYDGGLR